MLSKRNLNALAENGYMKIEISGMSGIGKTTAIAEIKKFLESVSYNCTQIHHGEKYNQDFIYAKKMKD